MIFVSHTAASTDDDEAALLGEENAFNPPAGTLRCNIRGCPPISDPPNLNKKHIYHQQ